jgi:hypothetical protein
MGLRCDDGCAHGRVRGWGRPHARELAGCGGRVFRSPAYWLSQPADSCSLDSRLRMRTRLVSRPLGSIPEAAVRLQGSGHLPPEPTSSGTPVDWPLC